MGAPARTTCTRGHEMALTRKFHPNGDSYCSECKKIRHYDWTKTPGAKEKMRVYGRRSNLRKSYGLEEKDYDEMLIAQNGGCRICGVAKNGNGRSLHVDHDHETGVVRGILCHDCNTALGLAGDSIEILSKMIEYLAMSKAGQSRKDKKKVY